MKRISALGAILLSLIFAAAPAAARSSFIVDNASMFGQSTVSSLDSRLANFNAQTGKEVVVVTVPSLGGQDLQAAAEKEFAQQQVNGVLIYIAKDDRKDILVPDTAGKRAGWFTSATLTPIRTNMESQFKDSNFDGGITSAVSGILDIYRAHAASLNRGNGGAVPVSQQRPYANSASTGGFHINMFWLIIILVAAFLIIRSLFRAMSAPRPQYPMQGGAPGAPGYGPGMGYGPGGYGGGGGSFFSGLLGGLGGAFLGNELFGNRGGGGESSGSWGGADTSGGAGGGGADPGGFASDAGQADMGGSSGGDWSGGGFGGDSGGGFGGGDFGGGGDSGGGW